MKQDLAPRSRQLREWLDKHNAKCLWEWASVTFILRAYSIGGHVLIVQQFYERGDKRRLEDGFFLYTDSTPSKIDEAFKALEVAFKLEGST